MSDPAQLTGLVVADRYRMEHELARGGMGAVYLGIDERLGRKVAVKVLRAEYLEEPTVLARFEREALAVAQVHHPGVVQVLDVGRAPVPFVVMEYVPGRSLAELLREGGPLSWSRAVDLVEQALDALVAVHAAGVVHRDLKPSNIMVTATGGREYARVLDFGIAQLLEGATHQRLTQTGALLGTPLYMAPEQVAGRPTDARTDVHAMGVVLWTLLTGRRIHPGKDVAQLVTEVLRSVPARLDTLVKEVPERLASIVATALAKDPAQRFESAAAFAGALREVQRRSLRPITREVEAASPPVSSAETIAATTRTVGGAHPPPSLAPTETGAGLTLALGALALLAVAAGAVLAGYWWATHPPSDEIVPISAPPAVATPDAARIADAGADAPPDAPDADRAEHVAAHPPTDDPPAGGECARTVRCCLDWGGGASCDRWRHGLTAAYCRNARHQYELQPDAPASCFDRPRATSAPRGGPSEPASEPETERRTESEEPSATRGRSCERLVRCCTDLGEAQSFSTAACPAWRTHGEDECRTTLEGYGRIAGVPASCR